MSFEQSFASSSAGMGLARARLEIAAENLANAGTTRTPDGTPFKRRVLSLQEGAAVVSEDASPPRREYDPGHPHADEQGWVAWPNVDPVQEMVEIMAAVRAFQANATAFGEAKTMYRAALDLGRA